VSSRCPFFNDKKIIEVQCGEYHYTALSKDGIVYTFGDNNRSQV
jgi:alpha-tubulin suppressor-like RCC1 family protein